MRTFTHGLAALLGALLTYLIVTHGQTPEAGFKAAQASHTKAVALGQDYRNERDAWREIAIGAEATADSMRSLRVTTRRTVLESPDSAAKSLGLHATVKDSSRCLPLSEFADLVASKIELELADSAMLRDSVALNGCQSALAYADSAEVVARADAEAQYKAGKALSVEVHTLRRTRWMWAAGGAVGAVLLMLGASAL